MTNNLLSVHEALTHILKEFQPVSIETAPVESCQGRVLSEDISAPQDMPPFSNSSMDGFAVRAEDAQTASPDHPVILRVIEDIPAGASPTQTVGKGEAARIMTGAPLPSGADAVIPVEDTDHDGEQDAGLPERVAVYSASRISQYTRPKGQDMRRGDVLMKRGRKLQPQDVGLLSALGLPQVPVYRQPCVALFSSGNELASPGQPLKPGQVYDSNAPMLSALFQNEGARVLWLGAALDDPQQVYQLLHKSREQAIDLIVTSAGVSVGAFDYVRQVIEAHGKLAFWRVNMRPGKPLAFGSFEGIPLVGLPGNPVSAYVGARVFVLPILHKLEGRSVLSEPRARAVLGEPVESDGRESYLRAVIKEESGKRVARLTGHQGSGNLLSLVQANALLIVPSGVKSLPSGAEVEIWFFEDD